MNSSKNNNCLQNKCFLKSIFLIYFLTLSKLLCVKQLEIAIFYSQVSKKIIITIKNNLVNFNE